MEVAPWLEVKVLLTKKYAERIDGVDLRRREVGDILDLPAEKAHLLVAEEWAMPDRRSRNVPSGSERRRADGSAPEQERG
jgi:hypothetical protein